MDWKSEMLRLVGVGIASGIASAILVHLLAMRMYNIREKDNKNKELRKAYSKWYSYVASSFAEIKSIQEELSEAENIEEYDINLEKIKEKREAVDYMKLVRDATEQYAYIITLEENEERIKELTRLSEEDWWKPIMEEIVSREENMTEATLKEKMNRMKSRMSEAIKSRDMEVVELLKAIE